MIDVVIIILIGTSVYGAIFVMKKISVIACQVSAIVMSARDVPLEAIDCALRTLVDLTIGSCVILKPNSSKFTG